MAGVQCAHCSCKYSSRSLSARAPMPLERGSGGRLGYLAVAAGTSLIDPHQPPGPVARRGVPRRESEPRCGGDAAVAQQRPSRVINEQDRTHVLAHVYHRSPPIAAQCHTAPTPGLTSHNTSPVNLTEAGRSGGLGSVRAWVRIPPAPQTAAQQRFDTQRCWLVRVGGRVFVCSIMGGGSLCGTVLSHRCRVERQMVWGSK